MNKAFLYLAISLSAAASERSNIETIKTLFENKVLSWHDEESIRHYPNALPQLAKVTLPEKMHVSFEQFFTDINENDRALLDQIKDHMSRECRMNMTEEQFDQVKSWPKPVREIVRIYIRKPQPSFGQAVLNALRCKL